MNVYEFDRLRNIKCNCVISDETPWVCDKHFFGGLISDLQEELSTARNELYQAQARLADYKSGLIKDG